MKAQFQQQVWATGQQYHLSVINMSFGSGWPAANNWHCDYENVGSLSAETNYGNGQTYPNVGQTPDSSIQQLNSDALLADSGAIATTFTAGSLNYSAGGLAGRRQRRGQVGEKLSGQIASGVLAGKVAHARAAAAPLEARSGTNS
jgi:hypothetical protein